MLCMINLTTTIMTASLSQHISSNITELALGITTITFVGVCTAYFLYRHLSTTHNLPPGPRGLPFIGALPWLSSELHHDFIRFGNEYKSEVVSFYTGNSLTVALNSERVIRDAFAKEEFSGRPADLAAIFNTNDYAFEGVSSQIQWCLYFLISHPSNQRRMVEEIKAACGKGLPTLQDKTKLPFCECVILEALRLSTLFTLSAPHLTTADTTLDGYNIPAGSTVFANIYAVHHDPETFSLPGEFNPDRFLKESGAINYSSSLIPFCTGRRMCIGEALVKSQVFLAVTQLVFLYHMTSKDTPPSMEETKGIFRKVPNYEIVFTKRID